uniref:Uncharacterized protein n=1 Tax=Physcomitrium patens TaxID=3218 RepID=A0A2K1IHK2_PHYPA|nr:hypothetical protein PHYPA_029341 [Physcomitrium patens]
MERGYQQCVDYRSARVDPPKNQRCAALGTRHRRSFQVHFQANLIKKEWIGQTMIWASRVRIMGFRGIGKRGRMRRYFIKP